MQVDGNDTLGTGTGDEVGYDLGTDGRPGAYLAVLACIAEIGNNSGNGAGRGSAQGITHKAELHQVAVDIRRTGGLDDKDIIPADIGANFNTKLAVGK